MLWLFTQIWIWIVVAVGAGALAGWLFWARPLRRQADAHPASDAPRAPGVHRATGP